MISQNISFLDLRAYLSGITRWLLIAAGIVMGLIILGTYREKMDVGHSGLIASVPSFTEKLPEIFTLEEIISTSPSVVSIPDLTSQLIFLGTNARPDLEDDVFFLYAQSSKEKWNGRLGGQVYLQFKASNNGKSSLQFTEDTTPLMIRPTLLKDGRLKLDAFLRFYSEEGEIFIREETSFYLDPCLDSVRAGIDQEVLRKRPIFSSLMRACAWEPDKLYEVHGGKLASTRKNKARLEVQLYGEKSMLFVDVGTKLAFQDGRWIETTGDTRNLPLAVVKEISAQRVDLDIWDETGSSYLNTSLSIHRGSSINTRAEEVFTRLRRRTASTVSLKLEGKSLVLKKGDWMIHEESGWRRVKEEEKKKILDYTMQSELFVFEGFEQDEKKLWLKGHLFDPMRMYSSEVNLPITSAKRSNSPKKSAATEKMKRALS